MFCVCILLTVLCTCQVFASGYDINQICSITLQLNDLETSNAGVIFELYRVGQLNDDDKTYSLTGEFKDAGVNINNLQTMLEQRTVAESLAKQLEGKTPYAVATTDNTGRATFYSLKQGAYLFIQKEKADYGMVLPFLVFLPQYDEAQMMWQYDLIVYPKGSNHDNPPWGDETWITTEEISTGVEGATRTETETSTAESSSSTEKNTSTEKDTTGTTERKTSTTEKTTQTTEKVTAIAGNGGGTVEGTLSITESNGASDVNKPKTGDDSAVTECLAIMLICIGIAFQLKRKLPNDRHFD